MRKLIALLFLIPSVAYSIGTDKTEYRIDSIVPNVSGGNISIVTGGNVGVNTVSPTATFEVNGIVSGTSFQGDGSALTSLPGQTQWNTVGSDIHYSSGSVAINKTVPSTTLDVSGTITAAHVVATTFTGDGSNLTNLPSGGSGAYDLLVGSSGDHADLGALNTSGSAGSSVFVATETVSGSVTFSNQFGIVVGEFGSQTTGTTRMGTGSDGLSIQSIRFNGNVFIDSGVKNVRITDCWIVTGFNIFDNSGNTSNLVSNCLVEE